MDTTRPPGHGPLPSPFARTVDALAHLKNRLFALTSRGALLRIAAALGIEGMEQRHTYAIINAIREHQPFDLAQILAQLSDIELKMLASDLGHRLATREERLQALLGPTPVAAPPTPAARPAAPVPAVPTAAPAPRPVAPPPRPPLAPVAPPAPRGLPAPVALDEAFTLAPPSSRAPRSRRAPSRLPGAHEEAFVAIDFETADHGRDSACAVALVRVEQGQIVRRMAWLIRPPRRQMIHTHVHGITWAMVANQPTFAELWPRLAPALEGAAYLVAHNAPFDRSVLRACCAAAGIPEPPQDFECTVQMAKRLWALPQSNLPFLCQRFGIPLKHHDAASDAEACARLVLMARGQQAGHGTP